MFERLQIHNDLIQDNSILHLSPAKMAEMHLQKGDLVLAESKLRRSTVCLTFPDVDLMPQSVKLNKYALINLDVKPCEKISLQKASNIENGFKVHILPFEDQMKEKEIGFLFLNYLKPYFDMAYRPLTIGNIFGVKGDQGLVEFKVIATTPSPSCLVAPETLIFCAGSPLKREEEEYMSESLVGYEHIGGCKDIINSIREVVELPLLCPHVFRDAGVKPPKGILMFGPPGTGKTLIARAIANETKAHFFTINGPELMSKFVGESEGNLRKVFHDASLKSPSIIFIDELDAIVPKRNKTFGELEKRMVAQLLTLMDGVSQRNQLVVIAATNQQNLVDPALRRYGRFDREIEIRLPDARGRFDILKIHTKKMKLAIDVDLKNLALSTHGYSGADLAGLCIEAVSKQIRDILSKYSWKENGFNSSLFQNMKITMEMFRQAQREIKPSGLRELMVEIPNVSWEEVGGLEPIKQQLFELIQYPLLFPKEFSHFNLFPSKGALLYGPPGCGKTLIAKAFASQSGINFLSLKGSDIMSMWFGESESNIKNIFNKARSSHPCILFFDEIDSIAKIRTSHPGGGGSEDRIVNQLLVEMDGITNNRQVFVLGATNRPDVLDSAIVRPGRLDQMIYIPLPDLQSRVLILQSKLLKAPTEKTVNIRQLGEKTNGFSGADLEELCRKAKLIALKDSLESPQNLKAKKLTMNHLLEALKSCNRSVSEAEEAFYQNFNKSLKEGKRKTNGRIDDDTSQDYNLYS